MVKSIRLIAFYGMEDLKYLYFITFFFLYLIILAMNFVIIVVIYVDRGLHEPMHLFLCNLAFNGLYGSTALLPPLLGTLMSNTHEVSLSCCQAQIYCLQTYAIAEFTILAVMGYDRYVAICYPLQYHSIMSFSKVCIYIAFSWLYPLLGFSIIFALTLQLMFCGKIIDKVYCINYSLIKLSCDDTSIVNIAGLASVIAYTVPQITMIVYSYAHILKVCLHSSKESQMKALRTCSPHLAAVLIYSIGLFFEICQNRLNMNDAPYETRIFMSLYYLIFPPLLNPAIYGISIKAIRGRIFKMFHCEILVQYDFTDKGGVKDVCSGTQEFSSGPYSSGTNLQDSVDSADRAAFDKTGGGGGLAGGLSGDVT
ncbi:olfactory receptor 52D1-like [Conger conger]|uniref:olfactory receptor 52D1-like n=1 Tax=Conger conger TaxID=82655 RepID=UPI002A59B0AC|nr:olfactory receptor 52D1-like [Conger conger]